MEAGEGVSGRNTDLHPNRSGNTIKWWRNYTGKQLNNSDREAYNYRQTEKSALTQHVW